MTYIKVNYKILHMQLIKEYIQLITNIVSNNNTFQSEKFTIHYELVHFKYFRFCSI